MRKKIIAQRKIFDQAIHQLVTRLQPEKKLKKMDKIINANQDILKAMHENLTSKKKDTGRKALARKDHPGVDPPDT